MHFSIHNTERESSKCFYKFLQRFPDRELLYFQRFFCFNWWAPGRAARCHIPTYSPASPLSQIKSGAVLKKLRRRKPVIILWNEFAWKNSSKYRNVQVFALMQKMLLSEHLWCEFSIFCIVFSKVLYTIESQKFWTETDTENLLMKNSCLSPFFTFPSSPGILYRYEQSSDELLSNWLL